MPSGDEATPARRAALRVLRDVDGGELADRALRQASAGLEDRDRAWLQELVYGTFRLRGRIDHLLAQLVRGGLDSLQPEVLDVLRLGAYQLLEMGSVPAYAAVSQSVELSRSAGAGRAAGLVNGVLQSLRRRSDELGYPDFEDDPAAYLSTFGSHPRWLVDRWLGRWGAEATRALVEANNRRPDVYLRLVDMPAGEAMERLHAMGVQAEPAEVRAESLRIADTARLKEVLSTLPAVVQDPAASLVVDYAAVPAGATVLDLCAAPGGKAAGLAEAARRVVAADASFGRLARLLENRERLDMRSRILPVVADARRPPFRAAEVVLIDAPCTGTGTLRRHPDGRWRIAPADLNALAILQNEILSAAADLVQPGGLLVYATCSLEPEENEQQVAWLLEQRPELRLDPPPAIDGAEAGILGGDGMLRVLPQRHGVDGAFAARLRRAE